MSGSIGDWLGSLFSSGGGQAGLSADQIANNAGAMDQWASEPLSISGNPQSNFVDAGTVDTSTGGGGWGSMSGIGSALSGAAKSATGSPGQSQTPKPAQFNMPQARLGQAQHGVGLQQLIQMLQQRDAQYFPTGGQVGAQPVQIPRTLGLLGF
jgi:hypothetical protein